MLEYSKITVWNHAIENHQSFTIFQDKERDATKSSKVPLAQLMNAFSQLCWIEKQYYSLTYLTPKRFLMKDVSWVYSFQYIVLSAVSNQERVIMDGM